jgi:hypothetical protein
MNFTKNPKVMVGHHLEIEKLIGSLFGVCPTANASPQQVHILDITYQITKVIDIVSIYVQLLGMCQQLNQNKGEEERRQRLLEMKQLITYNT